MGTKKKIRLSSKSDKRNPKSSDRASKTSKAIRKESKRIAKEFKQIQRFNKIKRESEAKHESRHESKPNDNVLGCEVGVHENKKRKRNIKIKNHKDLQSPKVYGTTTLFSMEFSFDKFCKRYRPDFDLLNEADKDKLRHECSDWISAIFNSVTCNSVFLR